MNQHRRHPRLDFRLRRLRHERKLTLAQVSTLTGLSDSTLSDLETGKNALPDQMTLLALCDGLRVNVSELFMVLPQKNLR